MSGRKRKRVVSKKWWLGLPVIDLTAKYLVGEYRLNQGVGLGLLTGTPGLVILAVASLFAVSKWRVRGGEYLLVGGGVNLANRLMNGAVVDWLRLPVTNWWFNLADVFIVLGLVIALSNGADKNSLPG